METTSRAGILGAVQTNNAQARLPRGRAGHPNAAKRRGAVATGYRTRAGGRIESDAHGSHINLKLVTSVKMNVLGIALIVCGVALICAALIPKFRSKPASTEDAIEPFVPQPWVDPHADEELNKKAQPQASP